MIMNPEQNSKKSENVNFIDKYIYKRSLFEETQWEKMNSQKTNSIPGT